MMSKVHKQFLLSTDKDMMCLLDFCNTAVSKLAAVVHYHDWSGDCAGDFKSCGWLSRTKMDYDEDVLVLL